MAQANLEYRLATQEDAPALQQIIEASFRYEGGRKGWVDDLGLAPRFRMSVDEVAATIAKPDTSVVIALDADNNDIPIASFQVAKRGEDVARLFIFVVDPKHQGHGLGRKVLAYAEDHCRRTWNVTTMELNALSTRSELIAWYMRRGYRKTGETQPFPVDKFPDLSLPEDLCFVGFEKNILE